jgi:uncharacterized membrane protein YfcA
VDPSVLVLGCVIVLAATFLAGVVGFAYGLVALPLLLLVGIPLGDVVVINLVVGLASRISVVARRRNDVNWPRARLLLVGCVPGVLVGIVVRDRCDTDLIQLAAGVVTLVAVAAIARNRPAVGASADSPATVVLTAGGLGGFLGVITSLNGVPPALLLTGNRAKARTMVADLAVYFVLGNLLTLLILSQSGQAPAQWVWLALLLWVPIGLVGNLVGVGLGPRMPYRLFRRLTIAVIVVSGLASSIQAVRSLMG